MQEIELFRFSLNGKKIGSIWINLQRGFTKFVGDRKKMQEFIKELKGNAIVHLGENTKEIKGRGIDE